MPNKKTKGAATGPKEFDPREHPDFHTRRGKECDPHKQTESKAEREDVRHPPEPPPHK